MIIDLRCRFGTGDAAHYFHNRRGSAALPGDIEAFFATLDHAGVDVAVSPLGNNQGMTLDFRELPARESSNDEQIARQSRYPGRYVGVAGIDVGGIAHDPLAELERCARAGLKVATIEPGRAPLFVDHTADQRLYPFYALAQELGVSLILQTSGLLGGKNIDYAHPRWIDKVAEDFPKLRIVCAHGCYPYVREALAVAVRRRHVFMSPDMYVFWPGRDDWVHAVNQGVLAGKFVFASAYPLCGSLREFVNRFLRLGWKSGVLDRILYRNAIRALGLADHPVFGPLLEGGNRHDRFSRMRFLVRSRLGLAQRGPANGAGRLSSSHTALQGSRP